MKAISFYTKYGKLGASSRLRSHQFITYLKNYYKVKNNILLDDAYIKKLYNEYLNNDGQITYREVRIISLKISNLAKIRLIKVESRILIFA